MRHAIFVNRYFHPDHSATSQMLSDLAFHLAARGWEVSVIASRQRYDDPHARLASREVVKGVRVRRVWSTRFGRAFLPGRAVDYATFYLSAFFALLRRRGDVVVALTDPPLISVVAAAAVKVRGGRLVNWLHDLFPEVAEGLGIRVPFAKGLRDWSLKVASANVVLGERMAARVPKAIVQHNWADLKAAAPLPHSKVMYSGNLGRAHEVETIVGAIERLPEVEFLFVGGGAQMERVRGFGNVEVRAYAPREELAESLAQGDVHLVSLQPRMEGLIVPSKIYGVLAVGRPVIFVGAKDGEVARIVDDAGCGINVAAGDVDGLVSAIRKLTSDRALAAEMGRRAREAFETKYAAPIALAQWERILSGSI